MGSVPIIRQVNSQPYRALAPSKPNCIPSLRTVLVLKTHLRHFQPYPNYEEGRGTTTLRIPYLLTCPPSLYDLVSRALYHSLFWTLTCRPTVRFAIGLSAYSSSQALHRFGRGVTIELLSDSVSISLRGQRWRMEKARGTARIKFLGPLRFLSFLALRYLIFIACEFLLRLAYNR